MKRQSPVIIVTIDTGAEYIYLRNKDTQPMKI